MNLFVNRCKILYQMSKLQTCPDGKNLQMKQKIIGSKNENSFGKGRKHSGKRRKGWLPAFSPFPAMFSKGYFLWIVKSQDCVSRVNMFKGFSLVACL